MMAIGLGARGDSDAHNIADAIAHVEHVCGETAQIVATLKEAVFVERAREAVQAKRAIFQTLPLDALQARAGDCRTLSKRVMKVFGIGSLAEAAALAAAGPGSRLILPRVTVGFVTVAAAVSKDHRKASR
jgi:cobalt-precorrin 5A hydrolase